MQRREKKAEEVALRAGKLLRAGPAVPTAIWGPRLRSRSAHSDLGLAGFAVEVRQDPLKSGARGDWDLELVVEVRQCPLKSGACEVRQRPLESGTRTAICSWQTKPGSAHCALELARLTGEVEEEDEAEEEEAEEGSSDKI
eukprot:s1890_g20.t1